MRKQNWPHFQRMYYNSIDAFSIHRLHLLIILAQTSATLVVKNIEKLTKLRTKAYVTHL